MLWSLVHGSNIETNDEPLVNGNAIVYDDKIVIHASSSSYDDDEVRALLATITLLPETLNGSVQGIGLRWEKSEIPPNGYITFDDVQDLEFNPSCLQ